MVQKCGHFLTHMTHFHIYDVIKLKNTIRVDIYKNIFQKEYNIIILLSIHTSLGHIMASSTNGIPYGLYPATLLILLI